MNIFFLDTDPYKAAIYHNDKHVVKMILETAQLISTCQRICMEKPSEIYYKITHKNHPCSIWLRECNQNFNWLLDLGFYLCNEYQFRFRKKHKSESILLQAAKDGSWVRNWRWRNKNLYPVGMYSKYFLTDPAQAMPEKYQQEDPVEAYRDYYRNEKIYMSNGKRMDYWTKRSKPEWYVNEICSSN